MHLDQLVNLFRIDGEEKKLLAHIDAVREHWREIDSHVTVEVIEGDEARMLESKFIFKACIPWETAKEHLPGFEYCFNWN